MSRLCFSSCNEPVLYLLVVGLSSRERDARNSIQRLQQEAEGVVVDKNDST